MSNLFKLDSFIAPKIWGGFKLNEFKELNIGNIKVGETYEVSTHKSGNSKIADKNLSEFLNIKYLVKFIDTSDNLSIQVHPGNDYAQKFEQDSGKLECWIIQECEKDAGIYLGFKNGVTKKELKNAIETKLDISKFLNFIPVKEGQFFILPEGLVHAIGSGVTLCEVQQSSGVTYRVWDWNRKDDKGQARELHIEKAMDVLNFNHEFNQKFGNVQIENCFSEVGVIPLVKHKDFQSDLINIEEGKKLSLRLKTGESLVMLKGKAQVEEKKISAYESYISISDCEVNIESISRTSFLITK